MCIRDRDEPTVAAPDTPEDVVIPAAPTKPEVDPAIAKAEAAKAEAIARINQRLELPIVSYVSDPQTELGDFLREMTELLGTEFRSPMSDAERTTLVDIKLKDCTASDVLAAALDKASLRYEVREDGIHTLSK